MIWVENRGRKRPLSATLVQPLGPIPPPVDFTTCKPLRYNNARKYRKVKNLTDFCKCLTNTSYKDQLRSKLLGLHTSCNAKLTDLRPRTQTITCHHWGSGPNGKATLGEKRVSDSGEAVTAKRPAKKKVIGRGGVSKKTKGQKHRDVLRDIHNPGKQGVCTTFNFKASSRGTPGP